MAIMWTSRCFGMILDAECIQFAMTHPFNRLIVQATVRDFQLVGQGCFFDSKAMILGSDFDFGRVEILHRLVGSAMPKLQLERLRSTG